MKKINRLSSLAVLAALFVSGCATVTHGPNQRVEITSQPAGATVVANGEEIGVTPLRANLSRSRSHEITVQREGFAPETVVLRTVRGDVAERYIRFGIDERVGAHMALEPAEVSVRLDPTILPAERAEDPIDDLADRVLQIDQQLERGEINAAEHRYILSRLLEVYRD